jgi:hypothetical protein
MCKHLFVALILAAGCGGPLPINNQPGEVDDPEATKADGPGALRMGQYSRTSGHDLFSSLELARTPGSTTHGTWSSQRGCDGNSTDAAHCFIEIRQTGTYRLTKSGSKRFIRMFEDAVAIETSTTASDFLGRFEYAVDDNQGALVTFTASNGQKTVMTLQNADKAQEGESCGGHTVMPRPCAPGLECVVVQTGVADVPGLCNRLLP